MKIEYKTGRYLFKKRNGYSVLEIEILLISKTAYKIKWESGYVGWTSKADFDWDYELLEQLIPQHDEAMNA